MSVAVVLIPIALAAIVVFGVVTRRWWGTALALAVLAALVAVALELLHPFAIPLIALAGLVAALVIGLIEAVSSRRRR